MFRYYRCYWLISMCMLFVQSSVTAQEIAKHRKVSILPVPAFGYAPETSTYLGAVSLFTFDFYKDSLTRVSNAKLEFNYTWNKQIIIDADWNYFFKEEKWFTKGRLHYSKFPDKYYGIGNDTKEVDEVLYTSNRYIADISVYKKVDREWFVGLGGKYMLFDKLQKERVLYPKLSSNNSTGLGFSLFKDVRNSLLSPKKGSYYYLYTTYVFQQKYLKLNLDVRKYYTIKEMLTFSLRTYNEFTFSQPPFYDFAFLGGDKQVRGYYYGRFRDNNLSTIQFEARSIFLWRLGLAAFGGGANLYSNVSSFRLGDTKYNYGLGLRFLIDRKQDINLRIDYAIGEGDNSGFYVSFGEAF